jgi:endonuclease/exonuclease/phosphatase family metal-dependent hydrolase
MHGGVCFNGIGVRRIAVALVSFIGVAGVPASAQTLKLTKASDTTLRGGSYAGKNFGRSATLATRASSNNEYKRRVLLKFDTHNTIPAGTSVASAKLTLTVRGGNGETRTLSAYRGAQPYTATEANWRKRKASLYWSTPGGSRKERIGQATVKGVVGSRVSYDVTGVVQKIVNGAYGSSRYLRVLITDEGASSRGSYKEFYSMEAGNGLGPTLTVTLGTSGSKSTASPVPAPTTTSSTLNVLDWNIHHGVDTGGSKNLSRVATWIATAKAHVASLNEVERLNGWTNSDQPAELASLLRSKTGVKWYTCFAAINGGSSGQGNLILSRYAIEDCDKHSLSYGRSVARARISVKGRTVNVFSTHLDDGSSGQRATQMNQIKSWASGYSEQRIIAGDFNTWPSAGEITRMTGSYYDVWAKASSSGTAAAYSGNSSGATRNSRIDYIFYSRNGSALVLKGARVYRTGSVSDHRPVVATFTVR